MQTLDRLNREDKRALATDTSVKDHSYQSLLTILPVNPQTPALAHVVVPSSAASSSLSGSAPSHFLAPHPKPTTKKVVSADTKYQQPLVVRLDAIRKPNAYSSWVPIRGYNAAELEEPYLIYHGESEQHRKKANVLYSNMLKEYKNIVTRSSSSPYSHLEFQLSDGEMNNGEFEMIPPAKKQEFHYSQKLASIRLRRAQRHAILHIVNKYGTSKTVFKILSEALQLQHENRVLYYYQLAHYRKDKIETHREQIRKTRIQNKQIESVLKRCNSTPPARHPMKRIYPSRKDIYGGDEWDETDINDDEDRDEVNMDMPNDVKDTKKLSKAIHFPNSIRHFCRLCMVFGCDVHEGMQATPRKPIGEPNRDERVLSVKRGDIPPCSPLCFSQPSSKNAVKNDCIKRKPWSAREITLLREAVSIFDFDPCNLAVVIGSRSCKDVHAKMMEPEQRRWVDAIVKIARSPHIESDESSPQQGSNNIQSLSPEQHGYETEQEKENDGYESDKETCDFFSMKFLDDETVVGPVSSNNVYSKSTRAKVKSSSSGRKSTFLDGLRNKRSYMSPGSESGGNKKRGKRDKKCCANEAEDTLQVSSIHQACDHDGECTIANGCVCRKNHFYCTMNCRCTGGRYVMDPNGKIEVMGDECLQTKDFCDCVDGQCNTSACICRRFNVACTPGGCRCDSCLLPSQVRPQDRKCKNCDFIVGRHKRTYIGNSSINGLGLYAGEKFLAGEVVGVYWGSQWGADVVDLATMLGEERKRTYSFDLINDCTIDATLVGGKMRFANHGKTEQRRNCRSDIIYVSGQAYIIIYTFREVSPGQELLFDYKLTIGNNWIDKLN